MAHRIILDQDYEDSKKGKEIIVTGWKFKEMIEAGIKFKEMNVLKSITGKSEYVFETPKKSKKDSLNINKQ